MRDQLRPVIPFLQGIISRTYLPVRSGGDVLDRHAAFMQGGRTRKNLAFSVHTGDLNEDDCEDLMHEINRWALRGERWAVRSVALDAVEPAGSAAPKEPAAPAAPAESIVTAEPVEPTIPAEPVLPTESAGSNGQVVEEDVEMEDAKPSNVEEPKAAVVDPGAPDTQTPTESTQTTEVEDSFLEEGEKTIVLEDTPTTTHTTEFHRLVQLQPPRPTGAPDYEQLAPGERMGVGYTRLFVYCFPADLILLSTSLTSCTQRQRPSFSVSDAESAPNPGRWKTQRRSSVCTRPAYRRRKIRPPKKTGSISYWRLASCAKWAHVEV